ncbi:MAG TPA: hydroxyacylglutathione hydrolase [Casimicrobiaceae bacterium]|jgi:hydroxyacylglutathione hydrolase
MSTIIPIPAFTDNYIWMIREGSRAVVVDPGDATPVEATLGADGLELTAIVATHHHADHVGGIPALVRDRDIPVFAPANERVAGATRRVAEGDRFVLPGIGIGLRVLDIPGHTAGHIACVADDEGLLFCGDTLFAAGCGRLFEGTAEEMWSSLSKLAALPGTTEVYCGHEYTLVNLRFAAVADPGNAGIAARTERERAKRDRGRPTLPSTIADELATNPFLRANLPTLAASASEHAGRTLRSPVEVFAELRRWKDGF